MKKIRIILSLLIMMFAFSVICVNTKIEAAGAQEVSADTYDTDEKKVNFDLDRISLPGEVIASFPVVTKSMFGSSFKWETSDNDVISTKYVDETGWLYVQRNSEEEKTVTLTVTVTLNGTTKSKELQVKVPAGITSTQKVTITYKDLVTEEEIVDEELVTEFNAGDAFNIVEPTKTVSKKYFVGWYDNKECNGRKYTTTLGIIKDITLYAKYESIVLESLTLNSSSNDLSAYPQTAKATTLTDDLLNNIALDFKYAHQTGTSTLTLRYALDNNLVTVKFDTDTKNDKAVHNGSKLVITSTENTEKSVEVKITVTLLEPTVNAVVSGSYYEGTKLSAVSLALGEGSTAGTISWKNGEMTLVKGDNSCDWKFVPTDKDYKVLEGTIKVTALEQTVTKVSVKEIKAVLKESSKQYYAYDVMSADDLTVTVVYNMSNNTTSEETAKVYTIKYQNGDSFKAGDTKVTISYTEGETIKTFDLNVNKVAKKVLEAPTGVKFTSSYTYDGTEHKITHSDLDDKVYTILYSENNKLTNKGSVEVTVTYGAKDSDNCEVDPTQASVKVDLVVNAKSIKGATISDVDDIVVDTRTFVKKSPVVTVYDGEKKLVNDTDYTLSYSETNEIESGKTSVIATITVTGKGNYDETINKEFTIKLSAKAKIDEDVENFNGTIINTDKVDKLPTTLANGSTILFTVLPTFMKMEDGKLVVIKDSIAKSETVRVTIKNEDETRYADVTFTVSAKSSETTEIFDATAQGYSNKATVESASTSNVSFTFTKGTANSAYYTGGTALRVYAKGTIKICVNNKIINEIKFEFGSEDGKNEITSNCGSFDGTVWTGLASEVVFTIAGTSGNRRIKSISVTFVDDSSSSTTTPTTQYTVTFNSNGGSNVDSQTIAANGKVTEPTPTPTKTNNTFKGWYTDQDCTAEYDFNSEVNESFTLYAKWEEKNSEGGSTLTESWNLVTNVSELQDGDIIVIACNTNDSTAGYSKDWLSSNTTTFSSDKTTITDLSSDTIKFTLNKAENYYTFTSTEYGSFGTSGEKNLSWDSNTLSWNITIENNNAIISSSNNEQNKLQFNSQSPRFLPYTTAQTSIQIYKLTTNVE